MLTPHVRDGELAKESYEVALEHEPEPSWKAIFLAKLAKCHLFLGDFEKAGNLLAEAEELSSRLMQHTYRQANIRLAKGEYYLATQDFERAWQESVAAKEIVAEDSNLSIKHEAILFQCTILLARRDFEACVSLLSKLASESLNYRNKIQLYELQTKLHIESENWKQAVESMQQLQELQFSNQSVVFMLHQKFNEAHIARLMENANRQLNRQNAELKRMHEENKDLLAIVAHDLKAPIADALLTLEVIRLREGARWENQRLERVVNTMQRMHLIVSQLTDAAKFEADDMVLEQVRLDKIIKALVVQNQELAASKQQQLVIDKVRPAKVYGHPSWLEQIFANLISNSIKYSNKGGKTIVSLENDQEADIVSVKVQDEGQGLSREDFENIFMKYRQVKLCTNRR